MTALDPQVTAGSAGHEESWRLLLVLGTITFLPTAVFFVLQTSSHASGLAAASVLIAGMTFVGLNRLKMQVSAATVIAGMLALLAAVSGHIMVAALQQNVDLERAFSSLAVLLACVLAAILLSASIFSASARAIAIMSNIINAAFVLIGLASVLDLQPYALTISDKPVFPFNEPSHYALAFVPFLVHVCIISPARRRLAWLAAALLIAFLIESLSLVVGVIVAAGVSLRWSQLIAFTIPVVAAAAYLNIEYFSERLDLNYQTRNLSALVYIQGYELIVDAFRRTGGWGVGFQQLGITPISSPTADVINRLLGGSDSNLRDGGFLATKLISEFGVFGLAAVLAYVVIAMRAALWLRNRSNLLNGQTGLVLANAIIVGFSVEMFVRGIAYFSGSAVLFLAAVIYRGQIKGALRRSSDFVPVDPRLAWRRATDRPAVSGFIPDA